MREHLNKYITNWEHADQFSDGLWNELCTAGIQYNNEILPSSQGIDATPGLIGT